MNAPSRLPRWLPWLTILALAAGIFALRWPTFGFKVWNVDEAIHAAVARTLLDGGVLYRDAVDQRTPLTYYAVAALFGVTGANNVWALHALAAALIAATGAGLFLLGREWQRTGAGLWAMLLFSVFASALFHPGDAFALNTEWFVALFTSWAAWAFQRGARLGAGILFGLAFLSKQPALLDLGAPVAVLLHAAWRNGAGARRTLARLAPVGAGFLAPLAAAAVYFALRGALADGIFYSWTYNLRYYGPEITATERVASAFRPFALLGAHYPLVLAVAAGSAGCALFRVLQRKPDVTEEAGNPALLYLLVWSVTSLAAAAAGGRAFDHYFIQFLPPFCLVAGLGLDALPRCARNHRRGAWLRPLAWLFCATVLVQAGRTVAAFLGQARLPVDSSLRTAEYVRDHSRPDDRIFVWGYHPDIYLFADRQPASRFVYASFLTGLIPWTNTAPGKDTSYAIVPGARETLLRELTARPPAFIVDCSPGPNRSWQKYPLDTFPALRDFVDARYRVVEAAQFIPQGYRIYRLRPAGEPAETAGTASELPPAARARLGIGVLGEQVPLTEGSAPHGASRNLVDGRVEYFAHAPSRLTYRCPPRAAALLGGFGIRPGAYAPDNRGATDGAEFIIRWRGADGAEHELLRRLLRPREQEADRPVQAFRLEFPAEPGGLVVLIIDPGPFGNVASDWTFWTDLRFEISR